MDIDESCSFCSDQPEKWLQSFFFDCCYSKKLWEDLSRYFQQKSGHNLDITCKDVFIYYESKIISVNFMVNLLILYGKFHIHKSKRCNSKPCFKAFMAEFLMFIDSLNALITKKSKYKIMFAKS